MARLTTTKGVLGSNPEILCKGSLRHLLDPRNSSGVLSLLRGYCRGKKDLVIRGLVHVYTMCDYNPITNPLVEYGTLYSSLEGFGCFSCLRT